MKLTDKEFDWLKQMQYEWNNYKIISITKMMKDVKIAVDIGACVGISVNHYSEHLSPDLIIAFEPEARNIELATENLKWTPDVDLRPVGIFYGLTESKIAHSGDGNPGGRCIASLANDSNGTKPIIMLDDDTYTLVTLEDELKDLVPDFIKIDVEGAEYNIIENSSLVKKARYLFIEWHVRSDDEIQEFIKEHLGDYKVIATDNRNSMLFERNKCE